MLLFVVALVVTLIALVLFVVSSGEQLGAWWDARTHTYATWITVEFDSMFQDVTIERAQRWIASAVFGAFVLGLLAGGGVMGRLILAFGFGLLGYFLPRAFVMYLRFKRLGTVDDQLVDALLLMANGLKAGLSLQQSMELVVREMKPPMSDEIGRVIKEIHLGMLTDDALRHLRQRVPLEDVRLVVDSILTLRETGGNLSETFEVISKTIVERKKVQGKIKTLTAQGMAQGVLICMMPPGMMVLFSIMDENYMHPMFNTPIGWACLATVFLLDAVGLFMMFKLVQVDV